MGSATPRSNSRTTGLWLAAGTLVALLLMFWASGAFAPTRLPAYAESARQITGMALMLMLVPPYLIAALAISQDRSLALIEQLRPMLPDPREPETAIATVRAALRRAWPAGTVVGIALGLLNTAPVEAFRNDPAPAVAGSLSIGQLLLWWLIGLVLSTRVVVARAFRRLGESISFDLFHLETLRPLARTGVIDVVIVAGALLISPLQALDLEFRWYNYHYALLVALPSATFFLVWPLRGVHQRIRRDRDARLAAVEEQLHDAASSQRDSAAATATLESLLAHRDRLQGARTWPLSTSMLSRVFLYLVFPPMAWAGAALVEKLLEWALAP